MFTKAQLEQHKKAALILTHIKDLTITFIKENPMISEHEMQKFVLKEFKIHNLINEKDLPIVAFNSSASNPHYCPKKNKSKKLKQNTLIKFDIWARLNEPKAVYADITWMLFLGNKIPNKMRKAYDVVINVRDKSLLYIEKDLRNGIFPLGKDINNYSRNLLIAKGYEKQLKHSLGHCLGLVSPHGRGRHLNRKNRFPIKKNLPYTIEPGLYFKNKFGIRSEINFYINNKNKLIITTPMQKNIVKI
jgi:Xaa-Pro aminopeptidase